MGLGHGVDESMWQVLQVIGAVDAALLMLPLFVISGGSTRPGQSLVSRSCGWTPSLLGAFCVAAVGCLCFSLLVVGAQLVALGLSSTAPAAAPAAAPPAPVPAAAREDGVGCRRTFARRLKRDLPIPLFGTAIGGFLGACVLWGQAVLNTGDCSFAPQVGLAGGFAAAYALAIYYAVLSCSSRWSSSACSLVVPEDAPPLMHVVPTSEARGSGEAKARDVVSAARIEEGLRTSDGSGHSLVNNTGGSQPFAYSYQDPPCGLASGMPPSDGEVPKVAAKRSSTGSGSSANAPLTARKPLTSATPMSAVPLPSPRLSSGGRPSPPEAPPSTAAALPDLQDIPPPPAPYRCTSPEQSEEEDTLGPSPSFPTTESGEFRIDLVGHAPANRRISGQSSSRRASAEGGSGGGGGGGELTLRRMESMNSMTSDASDASSIWDSNGGSEAGSRRSSLQNDLEKARKDLAERARKASAEIKRQQGSVQGPGSRRGSAQAGGRSRRGSLGWDGQAATPQRQRISTSKAEKRESRFENHFAALRQSMLSVDAEGLENFTEELAEKAKQKKEATLEVKRAVGTAPPVGERIDEEDENAFKSGKSSFSVDCEPVEAAPEPRPRYSILVSSTGPRSNTGCGPAGRKSVSIKLQDMVCPPDIAELNAGGRRSSDLLDMQVLHYDHSPVNFEHMLRRQDSDDSNGDDDDQENEADEDEEFWSEPMEQEVEVPVWLLERIKANEKAPEKKPDAADEDEAEEEDDGGDQISELPAMGPKATNETVEKEKSRRISFFDQVTGSAFESYSSTKNGGKAGEGKKQVQLAVRAKSDSASHSAMQSATFWKIPMPTRKNTMMPTLRPTADDDDDEAADENEASQMDSNVVTSVKRKDLDGGATAGKAGMTNVTNVAAGASKESARRPSVLGAFSNDGVKAAGLYALQSSQEQGTGELVEVKRRSIVMSTNMLNDILKSKVDDDRFSAIQEEDGIDEDGAKEVVLPFFSAAKGSFRQCHCQKDPATGFVIHTCMTPAATQCDNTQTFQSFVCSAWGSRRGSRKQSESVSLARSRRGSVEEDDSDNETELEGENAPSGPSSKRIRNASMLAIVGAAGPAAGKQDTDATLDDLEAEGDSSDDGKPEVNELSVSFKNISLSEQDSPELSGSREKQSNFDVPPDGSPCMPKPLDVEVEQNLGHKFELVEPWQLAKWLKSREMREQILTVDVRGRDWVGGHCPLSINLHTSEVVRHPESLLMQCLRNRIHHLIFTCMYSVLRARKSALAVEQAQMEAQKSGLQTYRIRISLLAGGMHAWVNHFIRISPQKALVQDFDAECWSDGGPSQGGLVHVMDALWSSGGQKALSDALQEELSSLLLLRGRESQQASRDNSRRCSKEEEK